ncbi:Clp protease N-terminal domain-containing protein [Nonomuraea sp. NPDC059194]|uniref:Clp protease N-terminal domain-containing protein n=1 Tax=Nonomuraea sp. NPDC059194 TaxID=3346764 RepID=UPI0036984AE3
MFERFTDCARRVVVLAQEEARMLDHDYIGTEHLLLGLVHADDAIAAMILHDCGAGLGELRDTIEEIVGRGSAPPGSHIPFTPHAKKVLELSLREALQLGHHHIGTEHVLLGLIHEGQGVAAQVLVSKGLDLHRLRQRVLHKLRATEARERPQLDHRLQQIQESLDRIERRLDALGAPPDPAGQD